MAHPLGISIRPSLLALVTLGLFGGLAGPAGALAGTPARPAIEAAARPNILFILTDDQDLQLGSMAVMPNVERLLAAQGTTLTDFFISDPLCCPSRSTILRGQYTHSHRVFTNMPPNGGYQRFGPTGLEASTVGTWLQAAGYTTAFFGKLLNGFPTAADIMHIPPGWSEWNSPAEGDPYGSYDYALNQNGRLVRYGSDPEDHITDVLAGLADDFLRRAAADGEPFFVYLSPYAPHGPADPAPRHADLFADAQVPRSASFNEADVSDKPRDIAGRDPLTRRQIAQLDASYRKRLQSLQAVDEMVARLVATLESTGQLANTVIVFTSDNGLHMGQHRLLTGKATAYEEDIHVPFVVRGPGIPAGRTLSGYLAGNVDLAPTFAELAGATPPSFVEGRSLVPLLTGQAPAAGTWRQALLVESYAAAGAAGGGADPLAARSDPGLDSLLEPPDLDDLQPSRMTLAAAAAPRTQAAGVAQADPSATFSGLRTPRYTYVELATGERELYDNPADPYQLSNLAATADPSLLAELSAWLRALQACAGADCRALEAGPPSLPAATPATATPPLATPPPATSTPLAQTATARPTEGAGSEGTVLYLPFGLRGLLDPVGPTPATALPTRSPSPAPTAAPTPAAESPVDLTHLPFGDDRILRRDRGQTQPAAGSLWLCGVPAQGRGASEAGDWTNADGTWDFTRKPTVDGQVPWTSELAVTLDGQGKRRVTGNALPSIETGSFPIDPNSIAYRYDRNPSHIDAHGVDLVFDATPRAAASPSCLPYGATGISLTGNAIYHGASTLGTDAAAHEMLDRCGGQSDGTFTYHTHFLTPCLLDALDPPAAGHSALMGYIMDGFGIYGPRGEDGDILTSEDLDACHGHTHPIAWDGRTVDLYHYHWTYDFPYNVGCFKGRPIKAWN
ncbi:MAG: sulfatase-like hydrolase/transferase [Chloroflexi bacterium]|nr:sulfatase-like hydrolase/transferase [Chloroflexota bacterium]